MGGKFETAKRAALIFAPAALVTIATLAVLFRIQDDAARDQSETADARSVDQASSAILTGLSAAAADVRYLAEQPRVFEWLDSGNPDTLALLARNYLVMAKVHPGYDQIRLIDTNGQ